MTAPAEKNNLAMLRSLYRNQQYAIGSLYCVLFLLLAACSPSVTPTPFIAPHGPKNTPTTAPTGTPTLPSTPTELVSPTASSTPQDTSTPGPTVEPSETALPSPTLSPTPKSCTDSLKFLADLSFPDDTVVTPGQVLTKQWRVLNDGTCDWDEFYRLKLVDGYPALGAASEMALYPARAGTKTDLSIVFSAPQEAGTYRTVWQASNPQDLPFGAAIYMQVIVRP